MIKNVLGKIAARPVVFWGLVIQFVIASLALGMLFDWWSLTEEQTGGVLLIVALLGSFLTFFVQKQVTPLADPRDSEGQLLTPVGE